MKRKIIAIVFVLCFVMLFAGCDMSLGGIMDKERNRTNDNSNSNQIIDSIIPEAVESLTENTAVDREKAKEIALNHAGLKTENITGYKIELDRENGILYYDIEFDSAGYEYDYEVNAETGEIIKSQKDIID